VVPVCCIVRFRNWNFVIYREDWLSIKFGENDSFRKFVPVFRKYLSVSRWNLPGYFSVSFRFPQVTEFGKSTANRRRSTWPILFVSFTQPCDQHDRRSERSARALHDGADVVREAIGNWFCMRICHMFLISKCRGDWDLGLCTTSVLALGEQMRNGKIRKKNVFRRRKNRILPLRFGSERNYQSCAQT